MKMPLKVVLIAVITIITVALILLLIIGRRIEVHTDKKVEGLSDELCEVFYLASLAPNSHNAQMWRVNIDPDKQTVVIGLDRSRLLPEVDPENREMTISLGCYTGMLMEAFQVFGYDCSIEPLSGHDCVRLSYRKVSDVISQERIDRIYKRHTDKSAFTDAVLTDAQIKSMVLSDHVYYYSKGTQQFSYIKENMLAAIAQQSYDSAKAAELAKWLRLSNSEALEKKDGLPAEQLDLTGIVKALYYLTTTRESATKDTFVKQGIDTASKQLNGCVGFLVITSEDNREAFLKCGIELVRIWLSAVECGVSVHPMSAILEEEPYCSRIAQELNLGEQPQMVLRLGIANQYGVNAAIRRDLADYITVGEN